MGGDARGGKSGRSARPAVNEPRVFDAFGGGDASSKAVAVPISARVATTDSTRDDDDDDNDAHKVAALLGREVPQDARVAVRRDEKPDLALGQRAVVAQHALGRREPTPDARTRLSVFSLCVGTSHSLANRQRGKKVEPTRRARLSISASERRAVSRITKRNKKTFHDDRGRHDRGRCVSAKRRRHDRG